MLVLVIEDERKVAEGLRKGLEAELYEVTVAYIWWRRPKMSAGEFRRSW